MIDKKRVVGFGGLIVLVIVGVFLLQSSKKDEEINKKRPIVVLNEEEFSKIEKEVESFEKEIKKDEEELKLDFLPKQKIQKEPLVETQVYNLFEEIDIKDVDTIKVKKDVKPVGAIALSGKDLGKLKVGDVIELPFLGHSNYRFKIKTKTKNSSGSISVSGDLLEDKRFGVVFTQGKNSAYISVSTPDGSYEIETSKGKGYIYDVRDIKNKRINYKNSDAIIPNIHK